MKKVKQYKGYVIAKDPHQEDEFTIFTKDEWAYGENYRIPEWEAQSIQECIDFIDSIDARDSEELNPIRDQTAEELRGCWSREDLLDFAKVLKIKDRHQMNKSVLALNIESIMLGGQE